MARDQNTRDHVLDLNAANHNLDLTSSPTLGPHQHAPVRETAHSPWFISPFVFPRCTPRVGAWTSSFLNCWLVMPQPSLCPQDLLALILESSASSHSQMWVLLQSDLSPMTSSLTSSRLFPNCRSTLHCCLSCSRELTMA